MMSRVISQRKRLRFVLMHLHASTLTSRKPLAVWLTTNRQENRAAGHLPEHEKHQREGLLSMNENLSLTHEELLICERLRSLRMSGMADAFESQMLDPNADLAPFIERFTEIVNHEWQIRYDKKFKRYLKQAHLRYPDADLDETIYDPARKLDTDAIERLATCHWIDEGKNLLITGMTSSGKTHLSNALCISALRQLKTVRYIRANTLMLEL